VNNVVDGLVCFVIGGFEFTVGLIGRIRLVESAVGEGTAEALVEEQEQERDVNSFRGQPVGVASSIAFQQTVAFEFTEVVAKLVESILFRGKLEGGDDRLVDLFGSPTANGTAVMQRHFEQADDPGVLDFDAGIADRADGDGQGDPLQRREVHMDVEALRLEAGEPVRDGLEPFADGIEMIEAFFRPKSRRLLERSSLRRKRENFSYCLRKACFQYARKT
jgi:hypothetical protein